MRVKIVIASCLLVLLGFISLGGYLEFRVLAWLWNWIRPAGVVGCFTAILAEIFLGVICTAVLILSTLHLFLFLDAVLVIPAKQKQITRKP